MWRIPMHKEIGSYEAKTHLPELLRQVRKGKSFTITNRGKAVAELVPVGSRDRTRGREAASQLDAFMRGHRVAGVDVRALREEGRR